MVIGGLIVERDRLPIMADRLIGAALGEDCIAEAVVGFGIVGAQLERMPKLPFRLCGLALVRQRIAKIVIGIGKVGIETDCPPVMGLGLAQATERRQRGSNIAMVARGAIVLRERLADQVDGQLVVPARVGDDAEQVQAVGVAWIDRKDLPVQALGLAVASRLAAAAAARAASVFITPSPISTGGFPGALTLCPCSMVSEFYGAHALLEGSGCGVNLTGIGSAYEAPEHAELVLAAGAKPPAELAQEVLTTGQLACARELIKAPGVARLADVERRVDVNLDELILAHEIARHAPLAAERRDEAHDHDQAGFRHQLPPSAWRLPLCGG
jgi:hypothetical protein